MAVQKLDCCCMLLDFCHKWTVVACAKKQPQKLPLAQLVTEACCGWDGVGRGNFGAGMESIVSGGSWWQCARVLSVVSLVAPFLFSLWTYTRKMSKEANRHLGSLLGKVK